MDGKENDRVIMLRDGVELRSGDELEFSGQAMRGVRFFEAAKATSALLLDGVSTIQF